MTKSPDTLKGRCMCGAVQFEIEGPFRPISICHCRQCAQWTGYVVAATAVTSDRFRLTAGEDHLKWFASSPEAQRGFCGTCGSSLFWKPKDGSRIAIAAGSLEPPTGLGISHHIFVADKSDYYDILDGTPQHESWGPPSSTAVPSAAGES